MCILDWVLLEMPVIDHVNGGCEEWVITILVSGLEGCSRKHCSCGMFSGHVEMHRMWFW